MAVVRIDRVAALTEFSFKKMFDRFDGTKRSPYNNEVTVLKSLHKNQVTHKAGAYPSFRSMK